MEAAIEVFARRVALVPAVRAVSYASDRAAHLIWTFISQRDKALRRQVYEEELRLMSEFPHFRFDFNVVALDRAERPAFLPDDLQGRLIYYREGSV